jgi:hypothetical protein
MDDAIGPTVTIRLQVAKFDGEYEPGKTPVEVVESEETIPLGEFLARQAAANGGE